MTLRTVSILLTAAAVVTLPLVAEDPPRPKVEGFTDTPKLAGSRWHIHDPNRPQPPVVAPGTSFSHNAPAPADAVVLFDGKDLSKWAGDDGAEPEWKVENGYAEATRGKIRTRDEFGNFQLHLEFATPAEVSGSGQGRGNNGVNIFGRYEIQILDSFDNVTYADGACGAIYGQKPPLVNTSKPPGEWQTYDIVWEAPLFDGDRLTKKANVTVLHNGVLLHHRAELAGHTPWRAHPKYTPHPPKGVIELYYHGDPVRFRNIWVRPIEVTE